MPKKFGSNTKSAEARSRKEAVKIAEKEKKEREAEDALWKDDDKHVLRKQQRKDDKEKRKQDQLDKKQASKIAYEEEMSGIKPTKAPVAAKVTRAQIADLVEKSQEPEKSRKSEVVSEAPLEENINRLQIVGDVAQNIDDAISILSPGNQIVDQHPERRMKAAYQAFEELHLPRLKAENSNLRLSQLKQMLKKDWMKSPDNPMNQSQASYNSRT